MIHYTLAVSSSNHDSSVCLLGDGKVLAMWPCERVVREKHSQKVSLDDLAIIKRYTNYINDAILVNVVDESTKQPDLNVGQSFVELEDTTKLPPAFITRSTTALSISKFKRMMSELQIGVDKITIDNGNHHLYHAAAGFYQSGFDNALCIVIDGSGSSWVWKNVILNETTSIFHINNSFNVLYKQLFYKSRNIIGWNEKYLSKVKQIFGHPVDISPHLDIGRMYSSTTRHIGLGSSTEAGKTMGLSAYGKPNNLPPMLIDDTIISNLNFFRNDGHINTFLYPNLVNLSENDKADLAYNVQKATEKIFIRRVEYALSIKQCNNLILSGGCAMNILANSYIKKKLPNLNVYVEPIGSDSSQSLGAAFFHYKCKFPTSKIYKTDSLYLGPDYSIMNTKVKLLKLVEQYNNESSLPVNSNQQ